MTVSSRRVRPSAGTFPRAAEDADERPSGIDERRSACLATRTSTPIMSVRAGCAHPLDRQGDEHLGRLRPQCQGAERLRRTLARAALAGRSSATATMGCCNQPGSRRSSATRSHSGSEGTSCAFSSLRSSPACSLPRQPRQSYRRHRCRMPWDGRNRTRCPHRSTRSSTVDRKAPHPGRRSRTLGASTQARCYN